MTDGSGVEMEKRMTEWLREGERLDDLQRDGLWLIQNPSWFCFGMDAVLLSAFARVGEGDRVIDLCTGNGVIPILLSARTKGDRFDGLELQEDIADMAMRSVRYNRLEDRVEIRQGDVKEAVSLYGAACAQVVTCNPPYLTETGGLINPTDHKAIARHELKLSLAEVIDAAKRLLVSGGRFYMVHRPFRLAEILHGMVEAGLEPKRLRMVHPHEDKDPNMVLIEGVRGGNSGMVVDRPLVIYKKDGTYTDEVRELYEG
ncbi:MAG: tRNA1(Val) (adenine(37)-N6)-methyltransferase [Eubacterium sp.]|nr:tRNA1(Val) (adenine(37)-N6)-methyltransferase [Eubacterium sp.]